MHALAHGATLILGLGKTGLSCARYLAAQGVPYAVADSRATPPGMAALQAQFPAVPVQFGPFDAAHIGRFQNLIVSPGISVREPAIMAAMSNGARVLGDIELFARAARAPVAAITGSNGKSTVTSLLAAMAQAAGLNVRAGGNLGTPALDLISAGEPDLYVVELSSFQLETTYSLNAAAACVLNVTPDHMDRYRDMADYQASKSRVYRGDGVMVINADDAAVNAMTLPGRKIVRYTLAEPGTEEFGVRIVNGCPWLAQGSDLWMAASALRLIGRHNVSNALAALALGTAIGLPRAPMVEALCAFTGLSHRTQWVAESDGVTWCNDSKGTNVGATLAAVAGMPGPVVLIAGGDGKGADFTPLRTQAALLRAVVLIGRDAAQIAAALQGYASCVSAGDMETAVTAAQRLAQPGDTVLLSPACASFDMYSGYEERGDVFMTAVLSVLT